ncbi:MAG: hypothetical protein J0M15_06030 [Deltaproteobacteria bacterium]|nr:hypothetical protein [Deltaproteobacteria bacterium]
MKFNKHFIYSSLILPLFFLCRLSLAADDSTPDEIGAKALLEEILIKRYSQGLATLVEKNSFNVGAQVQLVNAPSPPSEEPPKKAEVEIPQDLLVGVLDPEQLIKQSGVGEEKKAIVSLLTTKRIKSASISVGLREDLGADVKKDVESWLALRVKTEFGKAGKSSVSFVKSIQEKKVESPPKQWWDWANQFQHLIGTALLALTFLVGILFWRLTTSKSSVSKQNQGDSPSIKLTSEGAIGENKDNSNRVTEKESEISDEKMKLINSKELESINSKIIGLVPKLSKDFESIIRSWCQSGEEGLFKLVCFSEAVGKDIGRLPIPIDAMSDVANVFTRMSKISTKEKIETLEKLYWDLVSVLNLGPEVLSQPFGYLSSVDAGVINQLLMDQNPKMKTLVSLYLPEEVRRSFIKPLSEEEKLKILESAANLTEIPKSELKGMDTTIMGKMKSDDTKDSIQFKMNIEKIVSMLTEKEQITLLGQIKGNSLIEYRKNNPSLAFIHLWPDQEISKLLGKANSDEALSYIRVKPESKERIITLSPPFLSEMIIDEVDKPTKSTSEEMDGHLRSLLTKLKELVESKEINLKEIFEQIDSEKPGENNVIPIKTA